MMLRIDIRLVAQDAGERVDQIVPCLVGEQERRSTPEKLGRVAGADDLHPDIL
jgi:hypothetical protein